MSATYHGSLEDFTGWTVTRTGPCTYRECDWDCRNLEVTLTDPSGRRGVELNHVRPASLRTTAFVAEPTLP